MGPLKTNNKTPKKELDETTKVIKQSKKVLWHQIPSLFHGFLPLTKHNHPGCCFTLIVSSLTPARRGVISCSFPAFVSPSSPGAVLCEIVFSAEPRLLLFHCNNPWLRAGGAQPARGAEGCAHTHTALSAGEPSQLQKHTHRIANLPFFPPVLAL